MQQQTRPVFLGVLQAIAPRYGQAGAHLWVVAALLLGGCATPRQSPPLPLQIGDTTVYVHVLQHRRPGPTYLNVHDDENTSVLAGKQVLAESGGRLIELVHTGQRHVTFELDGQSYRFDPNRVFSPVGVRATLERGRNHSEAAQRAVEAFGTRLIETFALDREPVIIALHNTSGGGLSIRSYLAEGDRTTTARAVHVSPRRSAGDFFYVTDRRFFDYLAARDFNVVLQDDAQVPDDGSASVFFARKGIPYVNVEADAQHVTEQIEMIRVARAMVAHYGLSRR